MITLHVDAAVRLELHAFLLQQGPLPGPSRRSTAGAVYDAVAGVFAVALGHGQDLAYEPGVAVAADEPAIWPYEATEPAGISATTESIS